MSIENVLGLDLETTGLDEHEDGILEIGMQIIAPNFERLDSCVIQVRQPAHIMARMSDAVRAQHERSGLLAAVEEDGMLPSDAAATARMFAEKHFPKGRALLLGNSIHFDRKFVKTQLRELEELLHYRMIDASAIREAVRIFGADHRTMVDIDNSVATVREFVGRLK